MGQQAAGTAPVYQDGGTFTKDDLVILSEAERYLASGLDLQRWWNQAYAANSFAKRFDLIRSYNDATTSFGFFDQAPYGGATQPVMGLLQEMLYDAPKWPARKGDQATHWLRDQLREFVLRYFMRVSSFSQPEAVAVTSEHESPPYLSKLSWCTPPSEVTQGFGFKQLYYKSRKTGQIGKFSTQDQFKIIDLR